MKSVVVETENTCCCSAMAVTSPPTPHVSRLLSPRCLLAVGTVLSVGLLALVKMMHQPKGLVLQRCRRDLKGLVGHDQGEGQGREVVEEKLLELVILRGSEEPSMMWSRS